MPTSCEDIVLQGRRRAAKEKKIGFFHASLIMPLSVACGISEHSRMMRGIRKLDLLSCCHGSLHYEATLLVPGTRDHVYVKFTETGDNPHRSSQSRARSLLPKSDNLKH